MSGSDAEGQRAMETDAVGRDSEASGGAFGGERPCVASERIVRTVQDRILERYPSTLLAARTRRAVRARLKALVSQILLTEGLTGGRREREMLAEEVTNEIAGYGPIEPLIQDDDITEIMVNGPDRVYVERDGKVTATEVRFRSPEHLVEVMGRIVAPLGRRIDQSSPYVDARMPDGSRINAIIPPLCLNGPTLTIRKFAPRASSVDELIAWGTMSEELANFLSLCVRARMNLIVSGGAGSGKTTTLNVLSSFIADERIITIEDSAELKLQQEHVVSLESRPPNLEGKGEVSIRQLVRNALRMRPDRIVVGECRGAEAFDMLQAMNTGHAGCMSTAHANGPMDALRRLESMALMAGAGIPHAVMREQVHAAIDVVVHQARLVDGSRKVMSVVLVSDRDEPRLNEVFRYRIEDRDRSGRVKGSFVRNARIMPPLRHLQKMREAGVRPPAWFSLPAGTVKAGST